MTIIDSDSQQPIEVSPIQSDTDYKLLGVPISFDGNSVGQEKSINEKAKHIIKIFTKAPLPSYDLVPAYNTIALPALQYPLAATTIPEDKLQKIQQKLTYSILPKLGLNRTFPRAILYAPTYFGGIGFTNIAISQNIRHVMSIIGHLRSQSALNTTYRQLIESHMIATGITKSTLEFTAPTAYISAPLLDVSRAFLHKISGHITSHDLPPIPPLRIHDIPLMETAIAAKKYTTNELNCINQCRTYFQTLYLSELCNTQGTEILATIYQPDETSLQQLQAHSNSTIHWPQQCYPPKKSWTVWHDFMTHFTTNPTTRQLKQSLGPWTKNFDLHRTWKYRYHHNDTQPYITTVNSELWTHQSTSRAHQTYTLDPNPIPNNHMDEYIPIFPQISSSTPTITIATSRRTQFSNQFPAPSNDKPSWNTQIAEQSKFIHPTAFRDMILSPVVNICVSGILQSPHVKCGWTISNDLTTFYQGKATIVPTHEDSEFRSTIISAIGGLSNYARVFQFKQCPIISQHVIIWTTNKKLERLMQPTQYLYPKTASKQFDSENELLRVLYDLTQTLPNCTIKHINVTTKTDDMPMIRQQIANSKRHANNACKFFPTPIRIISPSHHATLHISNLETPHNIKNQLTYAATSPDLRQHLQKKYQWSANTIDDIDWQVHSKTLANTNRHNKKTITQFIHRWLPTNGNPSTTTQITTKCPICLTETETHDHFLTCQDVASTDHWTKQSDEFLQKTTTLAIDPILKYYMFLALTDWRTIKQPPRPEFCQGKYKSLFLQQSIIGWDQVLAGRLTTEWVDIQNEYDNFEKKRGHTNHSQSNNTLTQYHLWDMEISMRQQIQKNRDPRQNIHRQYPSTSSTSTLRTKTCTDASRPTLLPNPTTSHPQKTI